MSAAIVLERAGVERLIVLVLQSFDAGEIHALESQRTWLTAPPLLWTPSARWHRTPGDMLADPDPVSANPISQACMGARCPA